MRTKLFLVMTFVLFVGLLALNDLPQGMVNYGATPSYAADYSTGANPADTHPNRDNGSSSVPEPSSLMLMGGGVVGIGFYLFIKNRSKKK